MKEQQYEDCVSDMSETLFARFQHFIDTQDRDTAKAVMTEWMVDGQDPQDGVYEFTFLEDLTNV